jgi:hypothetical protein
MMTPTAIKHGRCRFSNLKISEKKSVKNRKLLKKLDSSPLKPFGQMNRNLVGSIYGKSSVVIAHFVPIR